MTWAPLSMFIAVLPVAQRFEAGGDPPHGQVTLCLTILYVKPADRVIQPTGGRGMLSGAIASLQELALISCYDAGSVVAVGPTCRERKPTYRHRLPRRTAKLEHLSSAAEQLDVVDDLRALVAAIEQSCRKYVAAIVPADHGVYGPGAAQHGSEP